MKYPFSPEVLDALPEELAELFRTLEMQLLHEICSRLNVFGQLNEVTVQAIRALRSHGIELDEIKKAIKKATGIAEKDLNKLFEDVVERNQKYYAEVIDLAGLTQPETIVEAADITAITLQCQREFSNITRSMGFLVDNGRTMLKPAKAYQWALDNAAMQIQSGAISYDQAIKSAVQQLADSGLKTVDYESGHVDSVDVAVRRAVMTGINQLNKQYAQQAMEYLETDLVQVSAHSGARDTGIGFQNHKAWQGKVYRWRGCVGNSTGQYPDFEQMCGYGDVQGILGANCRHSFSPFVEGVMERTYTDEELAHIDDGLGCEYDGKKYTAYEATQMQRRLERTIRKQKRRVNASKDLGLKDDATAAKARLRKLNAKYSEFSEAAGLPEQWERTRVTFADDATKAEAPKRRRDAEAVPVTEKLAKKNQNYADVTEQWRETATPNSHKVQDAQEFTKDGVTYKVGGNKVVLDYSAREKEIAELLEKEFGGELYMVPRVNNPQGVRTPDYLFRGLSYDLKSLSENATEDTMFQRIKKSSNQSYRFIIDVTDAKKLSDEIINEQIKKVFSHKDTAFAKVVVVIKDMEVRLVAKRI